MMYQTGLSFSWGGALQAVSGAVAPGPSAPSTASWWEAPLAQVAGAGADWVSSEVSGVPTYGGAPAYPAGTPGYQFYNVPDPEPQPVVRAGMPGGAVLLALGAAAVGAKLWGLI